MLGPHVIEVDGGSGVAIRAFLPQARTPGSSTSPTAPGVRLPLELIHPDGLFEAIVPGRDQCSPIGSPSRTTKGMPGSSSTLTSSVPS